MRRRNKSSSRDEARAVAHAGRADPPSSSAQLETAARTAAAPVGSKGGTLHRENGASHYKGKYEPFDVLVEWQRSWPQEVTGHLFAIGKYLARLGKKDDVEKELEKISVYAQEALAVWRRRSP